MKPLYNIIGDPIEFLENLLVQVEAVGLDVADFAVCDHICFRTSDYAMYKQKKAELNDFATLLAETQVNGRPIATFRLHEPIVHGSWRIDALELPAPKSDSTYKDGLEHAEFVIYSDLEAFVQKYPKLGFNTKSIDRGINPEVSLKLTNCSVKFHLLSLTTVVYLEKKLGIISVQDKK